MDKIDFMKSYLIIFGTLSILTSIIIPIFFPQFLWQPTNISQEIMISSIYIAMGVVMIYTTKNPKNLEAFIDFLITTNVSHAAVMTLFAENIYHLLVDSLFVGLMGILPLLFYPWKRTKILKY